MCAYHLYSFSWGRKEFRPIARVRSASPMCLLGVWLGEGWSLLTILLLRGV